MSLILPSVQARAGDRHSDDARIARMCLQTSRD